MARKQKDPAAVSLGSRGGKARRKALTPEQRTESARLAARARWGQPKVKAHEAEILSELEVLAWKQSRLGGDCKTLGEFSLRLPSGLTFEDLTLTLVRQDDGTYGESFSLPSIDACLELERSLGGPETIIKALHDFAETLKPGAFRRHIARARRRAEAAH